MSKTSCVLRGLSLVLAGALAVGVGFGCSRFSLQETSKAPNAENLAATAVVKTQEGASSAANLVDSQVKTVWKPGERTSSMILDFGKTVRFNTVVLRETGWNIKQFSLYLHTGDRPDGEPIWTRLLMQDKIEDYRMCTFTAVETDRLMLTVDQSIAPPWLASLEVYDVPPVQNDTYTAMAYLPVSSCAKGAQAKPGETNYLDPAYFDVISRVTLIGTANISDETGQMDFAKMPGTDQTYFEVAMPHLREAIGGRDVEIFHSGFPRGKNILQEPMRSQSIQNILQFLLDNDLDGFDFDWEFPQTVEDFNLLSEYIIIMKTVFEPYGKKISTAWYPWNIRLTPEAVQAIDYVNVMGYDEYDQDGNICSFLSGAVQPIDYFLKLGFRREQLLLGVPYYTRAYVDGELVSRNADHPDVRLTQFLNEENGFVFNGPQLISDKTAYTISEGLGGVFMWQLLGDRGMEEEGCLTAAMQKTMRERLTGRQGGTQS